jgi:hypothetical protein
MSLRGAGKPTLLSRNDTLGELLRQVFQGFPDLGSAVSGVRSRAF